MAWRKAGGSGFIPVSKEEFDSGILLKSYIGDTPSMYDWRLTDIAGLLSYYQYQRIGEVDQWVLISNIGSLSTDKFIVWDATGGIFYKSEKSLTKVNDWLRPSSSLKGLIVSNIGGDLSLVSDGELIKISPFHDTEISFNFFNLDSIIVESNEFTSLRKTQFNYIHNSISFELFEEPPADTLCYVAFKIYDMESNIYVPIIENIEFSKYENISSNPSLKPSLIVHTGLNTCVFSAPRPIKEGRIIQLYFKFTNPVKIKGGYYNQPNVEVDNTFIPKFTSTGKIFDREAITSEEWTRQNVFNDILASLKIKDSEGSFRSIAEWDANGGFLFGNNNSLGNQLWLQTDKDLGVGVSYNGDVFSQTSGTDVEDITGTIFTITNFSPTKNMKFEILKLNVVTAPAGTQMRLMIHDVASDVHFWKNGVYDHAFAYSVDKNVWQVTTGLQEYDLREVVGASYIVKGDLYNLEITFSNTVKLRGNNNIPYAILSGKEDIYENAVAYSYWEKDKSYFTGDIISKLGKLYICQVDGIQTGTFASNISKWNTLRDVVSNIATGVISGGSW